MKKENGFLVKKRNKIVNTFEKLFKVEIDEFSKDMFGKTITEENMGSISQRLWKFRNLCDISYSVIEYIQYLEDETELNRLYTYVGFIEKTEFKPKLLDFIHERLFNYYKFCNGILLKQSERYVTEFKNNFLELNFLPMSAEDIQKTKEDFEREGYILMPSWKTKYIVAFEKENEGVYYFESWYEAKKWLMG